jgi:tetratricopeptide (TPR) repeat protein
MAEGYFDQAMDLEKADAKRVGSAEYAKMVREQQRPKAVMDYYQQAIDKWQIIAQKLPSAPDLTARAWYFISVTYYRHLGDAEKALPYCQKVVDTWPSYEYAWSARALLAACYEALVGSGKITKEEGEPKIRQAYQAVIQEYPDCSLAESTYVKLGLLNLSKGEYDQAAQCLGQFVERYPQARQRPLALIYLGITYERSGKPEVAAELYRSFLKITDPNDPGLNSVRASLEGKKEVEK